MENVAHMILGGIDAINHAHQDGLPGRQRDVTARIARQEWSWTPIAVRPQLSRLLGDSDPPKLRVEAAREPIAPLAEARLVVPRVKVSATMSLVGNVCTSPFTSKRKTACVPPRYFPCSTRPSFSSSVSAKPAAARTAIRRPATMNARETK